jgi:hypothetical protein
MAQEWVLVVDEKAETITFNRIPQMAASSLELQEAMWTVVAGIKESLHVEAATPSTEG